MGIHRVHSKECPFNNKPMRSIMHPTASKTAKGGSFQDPFLNDLRRSRTQVNMYLVNGIKLQGRVEGFDQYVVVLRNNVQQMVYKHAISTIVPLRTSEPPHSRDDDNRPKDPPQPW